MGVYEQISIHALLAESDTSIIILDEYQKDFYPRSPCGERRSGRLNSSAIRIFLSTLSLRRATETYVIMEATKVISIHALLAESDLAYCTKF